MFISEPSSPVPSSEATPSSRGATETAPSDPALSPCPKEAEAQTHGEVDTPPEDETEEEKAIRLLYCSLCKVAVNSASQLQAHNSGEGFATLLIHSELSVRMLKHSSLSYALARKAPNTRRCWRPEAAAEQSSLFRGQGSSRSWQRRPSRRRGCRTKPSTVRSVMCMSTLKRSSNR